MTSDTPKPSPWPMIALALIAGLTGGYLFGKSDQSAGSNGTATEINQQLATVSAQNTECQAKFRRSTILYDGILIQGRHWVIPADVDPVYVGQEGFAAYSHYDPQTQVETIKLNPKRPQ